MSAIERIDRVPELKRSLSDPRHVCAALDLTRGAKKQASGLIICCPKHGEQNPSCSVTLADGSIRVKCFGCDLAGDVFHLIAAARNLDVGCQFPDVLDEAARIAGIQLEEPETFRAKPITNERRDYPLQSEIASLWQRSVSVLHHVEVNAWLRDRGLDPWKIAEHDSARALPDDVHLPWWASYKGDADTARTWVELGHTLLFPVYDHEGLMRSLRAGRVVAGESPKRLPPAGHASKGLVLANKRAQAVLGHGARFDVLIVEGEPDFLTWATAPVAVFGIGSGSWSAQIARRIPNGTKVVIRTHQDPAGDKYADEIGRTLVRRCRLFRPPRPETVIGDENDQLRAGTMAKSWDDGAAPMSVDSVDPRSFYLGKAFAEHYWLGDELKSGVFAARCPLEELHVDGERFDGSTVVRAPTPGNDLGSFRCSHPICKEAPLTALVVDNAMRRTASSEGL